MPPLIKDPEVLSSASNKAKLFTKNFCKNFYIKVTVSFYLVNLLELI